MKKAVWSGIVTAAAVVFLGTPAFAQTVNAGINVTANVSSKAKLTLGTPTLLFADADPDDFPSIVAPPFNVTVKARTTAGAAVTLTVLAGDDLLSGSDAITIDNLTWAAAGTGFPATGTSNKTTAQTVGAWAGSGNQAGSQTYALANSWAYATGTYTATLTYTLTVP